MKKRGFIVKWAVLCFLLSTANLFAQQKRDPKKEHINKDTLIAIIHHQDSMIHTFKDIQDEMLAEKVFESSKSRLIGWITFGGIAGLGLILFGFFQVKTYFVCADWRQPQNR